MLDVKTLKAPVVVVRYTVLGDQKMYKLYHRNQFGSYGCNFDPSFYFDDTLEDHLQQWHYHSHQEVYL